MVFTTLARRSSDRRAVAPLRATHDAERDPIATGIADWRGTSRTTDAFDDADDGQPRATTVEATQLHALAERIEPR